MDFALSEEQQAILDMAIDFGAEAIAPHALSWDASETMPREMLQAAAELGASRNIRPRRRWRLWLEHVWMQHWYLKGWLWPARPFQRFYLSIIWLPGWFLVSAAKL